MSTHFRHSPPVIAAALRSPVPETKELKPASDCSSGISLWISHDKSQYNILLGTRGNQGISGVII